MILPLITFYIIRTVAVPSLCLGSLHKHTKTDLGREAVLLHGEEDLIF